MSPLLKVLDRINKLKPGSAASVEIFHRKPENVHLLVTLGQIKGSPKSSGFLLLLLLLFLSTNYPATMRTAYVCLDSHLKMERVIVSSSIF